MDANQPAMILYSVRLAPLILCAIVGCDPGSYPGGFGARFQGGGTFQGCNPVLCPSGQYIVCALPQKGEKPGSIWMLPVEKGENHLIHESKDYLGFPDISPDGLNIVYVHETSGVPGIWISDITGLNARRLTNSSLPEDTPIFSGDGNLIAFVRRTRLSDPNRSYSELFIIKVDGTSEKRLTVDQCVDSPVRFSRDGTELFFVSERSWEEPSSSGQTAHLFKISIETLLVSQVLRLDLRSASGCDISMDETKVIFIDAPGSSFRYDIFSCNIDGSDKRKRTQLGSYISSARFGFHSDRFVFVEQRGGYGIENVFSYDLKSSTLQQIDSRHAK